MPEYDAHTALIVVDVQNDFADPKGSLYVKGAESLLAPLNAEIRRARAADALIIYSQDWHPASTPHFAKDGGIWPVHCVADTWGAELAPGLEVEGEIVRKGAGGEDGYSAFGVRDPVSGEGRPTELPDLLTERSIRRVVVAGLATDYCVKETGLDACRLRFETVILANLTAAVDLQPGDGERALAALREAGATFV